MEFKYENITISGSVAVGTNTLMEHIRPYLEPFNWKFKTVGDFIRDYTKEHAAPIDSLSTESIDHKVEDQVYNTIAKERQWVIGGWLAGFLTRHLKNVMRILLTSENSLKVDRVMNRENVSAMEAQQFVKLLEEKNIKKWNRTYGQHDFFNPKYYQVVIDTSKVGPMEATGKILDSIGFKTEEIHISRKS